VTGGRVLITGVGSQLGTSLAARLEQDPQVELVAGLGSGGGRDRGLVLELSERVRATIQTALYDGLLERGAAFA
jgi:hypothetical protein